MVTFAIRGWYNGEDGDVRYEDAGMIRQSAFRLKPAILIGNKNY